MQRKQHPLASDWGTEDEAEATVTEPEEEEKEPPQEEPTQKQLPQGQRGTKYSNYPEFWVMVDNSSSLKKLKTQFEQRQASDKASNEAVFQDLFEDFEESSDSDGFEDPDDETWEEKKVPAGRSRRESTPTEMRVTRGRQKKEGKEASTLGEQTVNSTLNVKPNKQAVKPRVPTRVSERIQIMKKEKEKAVQTKAKSPEDQTARGQQKKKTTSRKKQKAHQQEEDKGQNQSQQQTKEPEQEVIWNSTRDDVFRNQLADLQEPAGAVSGNKDSQTAVQTKENVPEEESHDQGMKNEGKKRRRRRKRRNRNRQNQIQDGTPEETPGELALDDESNKQPMELREASSTSFPHQNEQDMAVETTLPATSPALQKEKRDKSKKKRERQTKAEFLENDKGKDRTPREPTAPMPKENRYIYVITSDTESENEPSGRAEIDRSPRKRTAEETPAQAPQGREDRVNPKRQKTAAEDDRLREEAVVRTNAKVPEEKAKVIIDLTLDDDSEHIATNGLAGDSITKSTHSMVLVCRNCSTENVIDMCDGHREMDTTPAAKRLLPEPTTEKDIPKKLDRDARKRQRRRRRRAMRRAEREQAGSQNAGKLSHSVQARNPNTANDTTQHRPSTSKKPLAQTKPGAGKKPWPKDPTKLGGGRRPQGRNPKKPGTQIKPRATNSTEPGTGKAKNGRPPVPQGR
jgi:hypothetical protein